MYTVELKPGGLIANGDHAPRTVTPASATDLVPLFWHRVELDPGYRLGDLMRLVDLPDADLLASILGENIVPLIEEARGGPDPDDDTSVEHLRVSNLYEDGRIIREFSGWGRWTEPYPGAWESNPEVPRLGGIAVEFTPLRRLLDLPLRYEPALVFRDENGEEEFRTEIGITLIEFLKAVFWELTYLGTPDERDAMRAELEEQRRRLDAGEEETIPAEQVLREFRERLE